MWKKILSAIVISQIALSSAFAADTSALKTAFDELNYTLTVEWDQKDPTVAQNAIRNFSTTATSASAEERSEFFRSLLSGKELHADNFVENLNSMSNEEAISELGKLTGIYAEGASYVPVKKIIIITLGGAAVVFLAGLLMWELSDPQIFGDEGWK